MPTEELFNRATSESDKKVISVEQVIKDVHQNWHAENDMFGTSLPARSFASRALFSYTVPEVRDLKADFVYNYFTPDERARELLTPEQQMINIDKDNTSEIFYQLKNDKLPRYVRFSFKPAKDPYAKIAKNITTEIRDNLNKLIIEGAGSTNFHTGFELLDTNLERNIYTMLSGSLTFFSEVIPKDSPTAAMNKLESAINENGGLTGQSKKIILESLNNLQPEGFAMAPSDVPPDIAATATDPLAKQTFGIKIHNAFFSDVIDRAARIPDKVYQDEIRALQTVASDIQSSVKIDPYVVSDADYDNAVEAIRITPFDNLKDSNLLTSNHEVTQLGYIIQRYEVLPDETIRKLETLYADNPESFYLIDKNVRYGGTYNYKVRTVCKVKSLLRDVDKHDGVLDELSVAEFLLASEGVTASVTCTDSVPPPPPTRVRARMDGRTKKPRLTWQFPVNPQRDIKRFQIFKRATVSEAFTLIAEYDFDDSASRIVPIEVANSDRLFRFSNPRLDFLDLEYEDGDEAIYAIASVDAHGYSSSLSAQLHVRYERYKNKIITRMISGEGAPKPYPNLLLEVDAFSDAMKASGYDRMVVFFDPEYYRVFKRRNAGTIGGKTLSLGIINSDGAFKPLEDDLNFLLINPDKPTYKINIINVDLQKDETVNIKISDKSGPPISVPAAKISKSNINFEFGVE